MDPKRAAHLALLDSTSPLTVSVCAFALDHQSFAECSRQRVGALTSQLEIGTAPKLVRAETVLAQRAVDGRRRAPCKTRATTRA